ncbi:hypothetical protein [Actibacterium sp. MT2.3-13A]|uniref:hypothetical protein n=1 Tax=Actibacterium sp. MT2.3-13A TaxID=2828332 RepID=UPI001BAAC4DE|nr:hypothetical protein [Actibacterium sp. MT2.3-13A]
MTVRSWITYLIGGTALWMVAVGFLSGQLPTDPLPDIGYIVGYTIPFCGVALLPSALIGLLALALTRKTGVALRIWTFLASLLAIFLGLGSFIVA